MRQFDEYLEEVKRISSKPDIEDIRTSATNAFIAFLHQLGIGLCCEPQVAIVSSVERDGSGYWRFPKERDMLKIDDVRRLHSPHGMFLSSSFRSGVTREEYSLTGQYIVVNRCLSAIEVDYWGPIRNEYGQFLIREEIFNALCLFGQKDELKYIPRNLLNNAVMALKAEITRDLDEAMRQARKDLRPLDKGTIRTLLSQSRKNLYTKYDFQGSSPVR